MKQEEFVRSLLLEYFVLPEGYLIPFFGQVIYLFEVNMIGKEYKICISRRSLKHFVESRRRELLRKHSEKDSLGMICFAFDSLREVIIFPDFIDTTNTSLSYFKDYSKFGKPMMCVIMDIKNERLEIKSIHFTRKKKK